MKNVLKINNGDTTEQLSMSSVSIGDSTVLYGVESDSIKNEIIMLVNYVTDDGRFVQQDYIYESEKFLNDLEENYSNIFLHIDGTIAILESKTEEVGYYKYRSSIKRDFINKQNKDVRILMIERKSDNGRKEVRTTIVKEKK